MHIRQSHIILKIGFYLFFQKKTIVTLDRKVLMTPYKGVVVQQQFHEIEKQEVLLHAALILRQEMKNIKQNKLPNQQI